MLLYAVREGEENQTRVYTSEQPQYYKSKPKAGRDGGVPKSAKQMAKQLLSPCFY